MTWIWTVCILAHELLVLLAVASVLRRRGEPRGMIAWILSLLFLPVVGLVLFAFLSTQGTRWRGLRHRRRRKRNREFLHRLEQRRRESPAPTPLALPARVRRLAQLAERMDAFPVSRGNRVRILQESEETIDALRTSIRAAERHIHLEYYIFQPDDTGSEVLELLIEKARAGVECRLLLDYIGSWRLTRRFLRPLEEAGGRFAFFLPPFARRHRFRVNFRNHRKIAVIDGRTAFTGSQNIGDEYQGRNPEYGPWRDTQIEVVGPAAGQLQQVFAEDWFFATGEDLARGDYFPEVDGAGEHAVQIVPSGPHQRLPVMYQILFAAISMARTSLSVITPYLVPDTAMILGFQGACHRGVRTRLLVPSRSDARWVLWAGRSYYEELLEAGVEIYEYEHAVLHSKVVVIDDLCALVGSANMDERSFRLNFELTKILYSTDLVRAIADDFEKLIPKAQRISAEAIAQRSVLESMVLGVARLASPIL